MDAVKISVVVPVYNVEKYIADTLNSLHIQTFKDCEFIIIDDGSSDGSGKICDVFAKNDNRFKVLHCENSGAFLARKQGIQSARGEWILFLDGDDFYKDKYVISTLYDIITKNIQYDIIQFNASVICNDQNLKIANEKSLNRKEAIFGDKNTLITECFVINSFSWSLVNKIYRLDKIKKSTAFMEDKYLYSGNDILSFFIIAFFCSSLKIVSTKGLYCYRIEDGIGISTQKITLTNFINRYAKEQTVSNYIEKFLIKTQSINKNSIVLYNLKKTLTQICINRMFQLPIDDQLVAINYLIKYSDREILIKILHLLYLNAILKR